MAAQPRFPPTHPEQRPRQRRSRQPAGSGVPRRTIGKGPAVWDWKFTGPGAVGRVTRRMPETTSRIGLAHSLNRRPVEKGGSPSGFVFRLDSAPVGPKSQRTNE